MCPPPCGPRRNNRKIFIPSEKITKSDVDSILNEGGYTCTTRGEFNESEIPYEGCLHNLHKILHDSETRVKVAGSRCQGYKHGYRTIVMTAPCFPAKFFIRLEEE